jgi:hypothetical protein
VVDAIENREGVGRADARAFATAARKSHSRSRTTTHLELMPALALLKSSQKSPGFAEQWLGTVETINDVTRHEFRLRPENGHSALLAGSFTSALRDDRRTAGAALYSLVEQRPTAYRIAVRLAPDSRGGRAACVTAGRADRDFKSGVTFEID